MIPNNDLLLKALETTNYPGKTYRIDTSKMTEHFINGYVDELSAVKQAVYLILNTERFKYIIYSWDYGVELVDLIGQPIPYVMSEIPRRIREALTQDNRIEDVKDFEFEVNRDKIHVKFTVVSNVGDLELEFDVNEFDTDLPTPEPEPDPNDPESLPHNHVEVPVGDLLYVYCDNVETNYRDGNTYYLNYRYYF